MDEPKPTVAQRLAKRLDEHSLAAWHHRRRNFAVFPAPPFPELTEQIAGATLAYDGWRLYLAFEDGSRLAVRAQPNWDDPPELAFEAE